MNVEQSLKLDLDWMQTYLEKQPDFDVLSPQNRCLDSIYNHVKYIEEGGKFSDGSEKVLEMAIKDNF